MFSSHKTFILGLSASVMLVITPYSANAQEGDARDDLLACDTLKSPEERLQCFNKILEKLKTSQATRKPAPKTEPKIKVPTEDKPSDSASEKPAENPKADPEDNFGLTGAQIQKRDKIEGSNKSGPQSLKATVTKHWRTHAGQFVMELDNGQVWTAAGGNYKKLPRKGAITVEIKKGTMGGFRMKINNEKRPYRVKRLK